MRIEFRQEEVAMQTNTKGNRYSFITVVSVCFSLYAFVFPIQVYAAGEIVAWGDNLHGECNVPEPNTGFTAVSADGLHSLGLKADGSIVAWGKNDYGQSNVPEPNTGFRSIAAGVYHSLGLKADGSIVAWGRNDYGQCNVPEPNMGFRSIAAGGYYSLGLKQDGSIVAWGYNSSGQCNVPEPNTGFIAIAAGLAHSLGLKTDGSIMAWGDNYWGQCNVPEPNTGFTDIEVGSYHSLGLKIDSSIVAWGYNSKGQCDVPEPNTDFTAITGGGWHSLGLKQDGSIVAWGDNAYGECNVPEPNTGFKTIAAGNRHSLGLKGCPYNLAGDISNDCNVDFEDLAILADQWLLPPGDPSADIAPPPNGNGITDFLDYAMMANNWLLGNLAYSLEPYVMAFDENTEKIRMKTEVPTTAEVRYGKKFAYEKSVVDNNNTSIHEFTLSNLTPGTLYHYNVVATDGNKTSNFKSSFITSDNSKNSFRFGYFGDSRGPNCGDVGDGNDGKTAYQRMLRQMKEKGVEFIILGGDGVQANTCSDISELYNSAWENFNDASSELRGDISIPYLSALGNHEMRDGSYSQKGKNAFAEYWIHPLNGKGKVNNWEETTFSWRYGNTNFIFLNTEEQGNEGRIVGEQLSWFENEVNDANFDNKFVITHRALVGSIRDNNIPTYSYGALQGIDSNMSAYIDNLMYKNNVTAGLYSHDHYYSYVTTHNGKMPHIISGGAGAIKRACSYVPEPNKPFGTEPNISSIDNDTNYCKSTWHYIIIDVDNNSMTGTVYDSDGNDIHHFSK
jgi:hypothetical protein